MNKLFCSYKFKDNNCKYKGKAKKCNKTTKRCKELNNLYNFGSWGIGIKKEGNMDKLKEFMETKTEKIGNQRHPKTITNLSKKKS